MANVKRSKRTADGEMVFEFTGDGEDTYYIIREKHDVVNESVYLNADNIIELMEFKKEVEEEMPR